MGPSEVLLSEKFVDACSDGSVDDEFNSHAHATFAVLSLMFSFSLHFYFQWRLQKHNSFLLGQSLSSYNFFFFCKLQIAPLKFEVFKFYILKFRFYTNILKFKFYPLKFKNAWILYPQIIKFQGVKSKHPKTLRNKIQTLLRYKR